MGGGGNTPSPSSSNSVKFTLPSKNARSASAGSAGDVDYYNVYINRQSFENAQPGTEIKSAPIVVGTQVTVTVEAYGQAKDETGATVMQNSRIAYYTTTLSMPSSPVSLNIKMSEYKTVWHKVTLNTIDFDGRIGTSNYIEDGSSYTLTDLGTYTPPQGAPRKHTGWMNGNTFVALGTSVTVTSDMSLVAQYEEYVLITFGAGQSGFAAKEGWKGSDYAEKGGSYTLPDYGTYQPAGSSVPKKHTGWTYYESGVPMTIDPDAKVTITGDITFTLVAEDLVTITFTDYDLFKNKEGWKDKDYAEKGKPYILPDYGNLYSEARDSNPKKHARWIMNDGSSYPTYPAGGSVTIAGDTEFQLDYDSGIYISDKDGNIVFNSSMFESYDRYYVWAGSPFTLPQRKKDDGTIENVNWEYGNMDLGRSGDVIPYDTWKDWVLGACGNNPSRLNISPKN